MKVKPKQLQITQGKLIQGTASGTAETAFTLPTSDGSNGQVLKTNGSGTVSWSDESGGGGGSPFSENLLPSASDTYNLGSTSAEWKDLYLGDDSVIYLGNDQDVQLKHSPDEGVILDMTSAGAYEPKFIMESNNTSNTGPTILGRHQTTDPDPGDRIFRIWGKGRKEGSTTDQNYAAIDIISQNVTSSAPRGQITFLCQGSSNFQEGLRVYCDATATATPKVRISDAFDLPNADGSANQVLQTDGSGAVTWASISSGSSDSISDSDGDTKIQVEESSDEDKIRFDTAGTERMIITDDGKVGIGTSSPSHSLDVSGDLRVRGNDIRDNSGNPAITMDGSANVTVPNNLIVDGNGSTGGITITDGTIAMRTGTGSVAAIDMYCEVNNAHKISLKAPAHANFSGNVNFTLPSSNGTNGQYLSTDGSGNTSWATVSSGGGGGGGFTFNNHTTATLTAADGNHYNINYTGGNAVITLPSGGTAGKEISVKNIHATNTVTVQPDASGSLDGGTTGIVLGVNEAVTIINGDGAGAYWIR